MLCFTLPEIVLPVGPHITCRVFQGHYMVVLDMPPYNLRQIATC